MQDLNVEMQEARTSEKKQFPQLDGIARKLLQNPTTLDSIFLHSPSVSVSVGDGADLYAKAVLLTDCARTDPEFSKPFKNEL